MKCVERIKKWAYEPLHLRVFGIFVIIAIVCFGLICLVCNLYDSDMYFMLATGREIVDNGIPYMNPWSADTGFGIVVQQWLYDVLLYHVEQFGHVGFSVFVLAQVFVFLGLCLGLLRLRKVRWKSCFLALGIIFVCFQVYLFSIRPQLITVILLLCDCLAWELFGMKKRGRYLLILPVTMVLEMNLHMAMWPFHFCIMFAYMVPVFGLKHNGNQVAKAVPCKQKSVLFAVLGMVGALFLNPYGLDGILYVFRSMGGDAFHYVSIVEMQPINLFSGETLVLIIGTCIILLNWKKGKLWGPAVNMFLGFGLLTLVAFRNYILLLIPVLLLLRDFSWVVLDMLPDVDWKKDVRNYLLPILVAMDVLFLYGLFSSCQSVFFSGEDSLVPSVGTAVSYIQEHWNGEGSIFIGFDSGAFFEYQGLDKIYMDARPELFTKEVNGKKTILAEYAVYCEYGDIFRDRSYPEEESDFYVSKEKMDSWLQAYDFQYVCVAPGVEPHLYGYMLNCPDYEYVQEASSLFLSVYEKR